MLWRWDEREEEGPRVRARGRGTGTVTGMLTLRPAEAAWEGMPEMPPPMGLRLEEADAVVGAIGSEEEGGVTVGGAGGGGVGVEEVDAGVDVDVAAEGVDLGEFVGGDSEDCGIDRHRERERLRAREEELGFRR